MDDDELWPGEHLWVTRLPLHPARGVARHDLPSGQPPPPDLLRPVGAAQGPSDAPRRRRLVGRPHCPGANVGPAVEALAKALALRVAGSADAALIYASTVALQRAREVLDQQS